MVVSLTRKEIEEAILDYIDRQVTFVVDRERTKVRHFQYDNTASVKIVPVYSE